MQNILKSKIFIGAILAVAAIAVVAVIAVNVNHSGSDLQAQLDLGKRYVSELDYENAVIAYEEALKIDPYCLEAYLGLSDAYMALGQQDKAIEIMEQAKKMLPDSVEVYASLAQMYASQNQIELVISTLEEGIRVTDSDRLKEMLKEYQPGDDQPEQGQAQISQESEDVEERESEEVPTQEDQDGEEEEPAIAVGLQQEDRTRNTAPVLTVTRGDEEPVRIPLTVPEQPLQPALENNQNTGGEIVNDNGSEGDESQSGGSDSSSSNGGGNHDSGSEDNSGTVAAPRTGITGNIYGIDGQGIEGVTVTIFSGQNESPVLANTDTIGNYIQELSAGTYRIVLSKAGYVDLSTTVAVLNDVLTSSSYIMLTEEESRQSALLKGVVINAINSQNIEGATVVLLDGFDNTTNGDQNTIAGNRHTTTGSDGRFSLDDGVNAGYYTVEVSQDGYSTYSHNETIKPGENELAVSMSPEIQTLGEYRIVLTWGETPRDLDSHLICTGNDNYHVYYGNKNSSDGKASLDVDDVTSYGPETTTVIIGAGNSYIYAVHNFTNSWASPGESSAWNLANSDARVVVYSGEGVIFDGNVPVNEEGTTWEVFRIENGHLVVKNNIVFEYPSELADNDTPAVAQAENVGIPIALSLSEEETAETMEIEAEEIIEQNQAVIEEVVEQIETESEETVETLEDETGEALDLIEAEPEETEEQGEVGADENVEVIETGSEETVEPAEVEAEEAAEPEESGAEENNNLVEIESEEATESEGTESEENAEPKAAEPEDCLKPEEDGFILENTETAQPQEPVENSEEAEQERNNEIISTDEATEEVHG